MTTADNTGDNRTSRQWKWLVALVAGCAIATYGFWPRGEVEPDQSEEPLSSQSGSETKGGPEPKAPYVNPAGYVGPEKCSACHKERVHEFRQSRHYLACVAASDKTMPAAFQTGDAEYQPPRGGVRFEMRKNGEDFVQIALRATPSGIERNVAPISLMYGYDAGTDEVYFTWKDDSLFELPMSWLYPLQEWGVTSFDSADARETTPRCVECHNTWLEHVPGTKNQYRPESLIAGVTCEACHGPAKNHVEFHELNPAEKSPMHIVRPALLSRDLQMDLCAYCHSNSMKHRHAAFSYRPGTPLAETYRSLVTRNPENDHVANQTAYLKLSKCYQESDSLTCTTCHSPHVSRKEQHGTQQSACMSCHQQEHCREQPRLPEPVQKNCVGCHMPKRNKIQVNFDTKADALYPAAPRWEHRIAVDLTARDEVLLEWHSRQTGDESRKEAARLSKSLAEREHQEGDRLSGEYRFLAAVEAYRRSLGFSPSNEVQEKFQRTSGKYLRIAQEFSRAENQLAERKTGAAIATLEQLLVEKPDHAKAHGRLGTLFAATGETGKALKHWQAVSELDPDDAYGEGMIGWYWYLQNEPQKAVTALLKADELEPHSFRVNYNLALAYRKLGESTEAEARLSLANQIEPQNIQSGLALRGLLRDRREFDRALKVVEVLSHRTSRQEPDVEIARAESQVETGRTAEAIVTLNLLLKKTPATEIRLRTELSNRIGRLQTLPSTTGR
ncbi:MAG: tetratricopeptide repeat protein [Planctomycetota bacterium]|nr:tetratricopeptide repeat protein [Planctomycetota bacterium]MDA1248656.1 tetratricopeptide repeat protein [Planctomycetota bacterium]